MGTVSYGGNPLKCPYVSESDTCKELCFTSTESLKAHLETAHQLTDVQINLVCPCPAECNGNKECEDVAYDQHTGMFLEDHLTAAHKEFYEKLETLTCCINCSDDDDDDDLEEFLEENDLVKQL
ncbi:uncharacterized protein LOC129592117 [Paramacrobiotus metropolitanus]|uniref:uncharacterized protein LOC129592117 n=1 Tax=Paramacrobiotus metropolitanus TaxID=2943436 RepID=UPI0024462D8C|nr:uncharacterized protein LOC129592117 [Paramacrobiotus metropolitanus]